MSSIVSIIIPCYNSETWVVEAIESGLAQTYPNIEIVVVDDGSKDNSLAVIKAYESRVIILSGYNQKLSAARNKGVAASCGDYYLFLDADDYIAPDTVAALVEGIAGRPNCLSVCPWSSFVDGPNGRQIVEIGENYLIEGDLFYNRFTKWFMPPHSVLWPRPIFERLGGWDEQLLNYHDYDLMARAILEGIGLYRVNEGHAFYRKHMDLISSSGQLSRAHICSRIYFVEKLERTLSEKGLLEKYDDIVGHFYANIASNTLGLYEDLADLCIERAQEFGGAKIFMSGSQLHNFGIRLLGYKRKEWLARMLSEVGIGSQQRKHLTSRQKHFRETIGDH